MEEGERRAMEEQDSARRQQPEESAGGEEIREESGLPSQWPLFGSPTLTTIRVTSYRDKGGTIVSFIHILSFIVILCTVCV